ncbi:Cyclochlorotine biosynthesis protein O [Paramyrothecium foliicola]|nr:Cyclochlorotine biosynthesis protein O [Paramyrothecium foliicola]
MASNYTSCEQSNNIDETVPLSDASSEFKEKLFGLEEGLRRQQRQRWKGSILVRAVGLSLLAGAFFTAGFFARRFPKLDERACLDTGWDKLRQPDAIKFRTEEFNPHFTGPPSPYMGQPNAQVDKLWYDLSELRNFGVDRQTLEAMNRSKGAVEFLKDGEHTGLYETGLEAFHQLHCLNYIRMYSYMDYYEKIDFDMVAESAEKRQEHKDHCVEVLRQRLMCNPDLNIYSYHWFTIALATALLAFTATASPLPIEAAKAEVVEAAENGVDAAATRAGWLYIRERDNAELAEVTENGVDAAATRAGWLYAKKRTAVEVVDATENGVDAAATRAGWLYIKERDVAEDVETIENGVDAAATRAGWLYTKKRDVAEQVEAAENNVDAAATRAGWLYIKERDAAKEANLAENGVDAAATRAGWLYIKERDVAEQAEVADNNVDAAATRAGWLYVKERNVAET